MRWPSRADWSAHLAHYYDGQIRWEGRRVSEPRQGGLFAWILGVDGVAPRPEPPVIERGYARRTCPHCGAVAVRPVDMPRDIHVFPPGHLPRRDRRGRIVGDVCPELTSPD